MVEQFKVLEKKYTNKRTLVYLGLISSSLINKELHIRPTKHIEIKYSQTNAVINWSREF